MVSLETPKPKPGSISTPNTMVSHSPSPKPSPASKILLFGSQSLSFSPTSVTQLLTTLLTSPSLNWILETISQLLLHWESLQKAVPALQAYAGGELLEDLKDWLRTGKLVRAEFPLPNILLTPLVVILHLTQYVELLERVQRDESNGIQDFRNDAETLGLCTGLLSAAAVSCSAVRVELQHYGAVAVRLAMAIGALVDALEMSEGKSRSFSLAWSSPELVGKIDAILESFPKAYISVIYSPNHATLTCPSNISTPLQHELKEAGISVSDIALRGSFHCTNHHKEAAQLIDFCDSNPLFQFPDAGDLEMPNRSNSGDGGYITTGKVHHAVLEEILLRQSNWHEAFASLQSTTLSCEGPQVISFGSERCVPSVLVRTLGDRLIPASEFSSGKATLAKAKSLLTGVNDPSDNAIAIIGTACQVPGASDMEEFRELLQAGVSQHQQVPEERFTFETNWREADPKRKWYGNFIKDYDTFDHKFFGKSPRESATTDPQHRLMLQTAYQALEQSGYFSKPVTDKHIGCYIGASLVDYENNIACYPANAYTATGNLRSFLAGKISHYFGWTGPGLIVDTACSSSAVAVHMACKAILSGEISAALAGGVNVMTSPGWFQNLAGASFLSPTGQCKPFDVKADGYCRGEAVGAVFLKRLSSAIEDGDQVFGVIRGSAVYQNQNCTAITVPNSISLSTLFQDVTRQSGLEPNQISVVEAHGTGTPVGDPAEYNSIRKVLAGPNRSSTLSLGSVKGLVGHTEVVSGIVAILKILVMMQDGFIPPQPNFSKMNPALNHTPGDKIEIATSLKPWDTKFRAALINNYGASGSNATLVITQSSATKKEPTEISTEAKYPFWFSGLDDKELKTYSAKFRKFLDSKPHVPISNLSFQLARQSNRSLGRSLIFSCSSVNELKEKLSGFENGTGIASSARPGSRPVILTFGGQISKFIGLDKQIYDNVAVFRTHLDHCNAVCNSLGLGSIFPGIFQRSPIEDIVELHTGLFAMQYSCAKSWIDCGVEVAAVVGHSFGELTALAISGVLSLRDALKAISNRARLVQEGWNTDRGAMMAVEGDFADVEKLLKGSDATIACFNGPTSFTIAGSTEVIDALEESVRALKSIKSKRLSVTHAFHSTLVEPLMTDLKRVGQGLVFNEPTIPFERVTEIESSPKLSASFFADHLRNPVYFDHAVQRLSKKYPSAVFLEAGSNSTITTMAARALNSPKSMFFQPINLTSEGSFQFLTEATERLWKEGLSVAFWPHHKSQTAEYSPLLLPPYQFEKSKHWMELKKPQKAVPVSVEAPQAVELPKGLWTFVGYQDSQKRQVRFRVNTFTEKFAKYCNGHLMCNTAALTPSTLQLDIAIEALMSLRPEFSDSTLQPQAQGIESHAPMVLDISKYVWLDASAVDAQGLIWDWKMISESTQAGPKTKHVSGRVTFRSKKDPQYLSDFSRFERLVERRRCTNLLDGNGADDVIQGRNIYRTFKEIVDYDLEVFPGLQKIAGKGNESASRITAKFPNETWLDVGLADSFMLTSGIYINSMSDIPSTDMFISDKIESWIRSPQMTSRPEAWECLAIHSRPSEKQDISDIFVFDANSGALVEVVLGVRFQKVNKAGMSKMLSKLSPGPPASEVAAPSVSARMNVPMVNGGAKGVTNVLNGANNLGPPSPPLTPSLKATKAILVKKKSSKPDISGPMQTLVCDLSGMEPEEVKNDSDLVNLGIDSLMSMELVREIELAFKVTLSNEQLLELTDFHSLVKCVQRSLGGDDLGGNDSADTDMDNDSQGAQTPEETPAKTPIRKTSSKPDISGPMRNILCDLSGMEPEEVKNDSDLVELGIDSLMSMELVREVELVFKITLSNEQLLDLTDFNSLVKCVQASLAGDAMAEDNDGGENDADTDMDDSEGIKTPEETPKVNGSRTPEETAEVTGINHAQPDGEHRNGLSSEKLLPAETILRSYNETKQATDTCIAENRLGDYMHKVVPKSTELCVVHILDAFDELGCSIRQAKQGEEIKRIEYLPRHQQLVDLIYDLLENEARLVDMVGSRIVRTAISCPSKPAKVLLQELIKNFPDTAWDHKLTSLAGAKLAECLIGKADGIQLIFGNSEGCEIVSKWYAESPINLVCIKQLEDFIQRLLPNLPNDGGPLKIMEMGAGTGGTTSRILPVLDALNVPVEYTFTDISASLVAAARKRFKKYSFVKYQTFDFEKGPAAEQMHSQHIVVATNCVHATHNLAKTTRNIHKVLRPDGFLLLLELTQALPYVDLVFGLVEGWWLFDDDRKHVLASPSLWEKTLHEAGYGHVDWTEGERPEASVHRMIIAFASSPRYDRIPVVPKRSAVQSTDLVSREVTIDRFVKKYTEGLSSFPPASKTKSLPSEHCVLLTGATGSLGSHLVEYYAQIQTVRQVICLNRHSSTEATQRQHQALVSRGISLSQHDLSKLKVIEGDTSKPLLGLTEREHEYLADNVTLVIHNAWPMSMSRPVNAYEAQFKAMRNLVNLARDSSAKQSCKVGFQFVSSIAVVGFYPLWSGKARVPEEPMNIESVLPNGYGDAKLICERMLDQTLGRCPGHFRVMVARIGQIAGSKINGHWNSSEHLAALIKSCQTLKTLPDLQGELSWCPVNDIAANLGELALSTVAAYPIYHVENRVRQSWSEMICILADSLDIPTTNIVPFHEWVARVRRFPGSTDLDNPAGRLIDFLDQHFIRMSSGALILDTKKSVEHSKTLANSRAVSAELVRKYIGAWKDEGFLYRY